MEGRSKEQALSTSAARLGMIMLHITGIACDSIGATAGSRSQVTNA